MFLSLTVVLVLSLFITGVVNVLTLAGFCLLHSPGGASYVTYMRGVFMSLIVVLVCLFARSFVCLFQLFVNDFSLEGCCFFTWPCRGVSCYTYARGAHVPDSCIRFSLFVYSRGL